MRTPALAATTTLCLVFGGGFVIAAPNEEPESLTASPIERLRLAYVDYSPNGMPDFSTCRPEWSLPPTEPGNPGQWTHAAPVALANALWWLDSRAETAGTPPPAVADTHALVTAYPYFGPRRDDHVGDTVGPLVRDLAARANTDGLLKPIDGRGTAWNDFVAGAQDYVASRKLDSQYQVEVRRASDFAWIEEHGAEDAAVVLLLGAWEQGAEGWGRIGGHYVTVAGEGTGERIWLSDPLGDRAAEAGTGRTWPSSPEEHSCREAPRSHDDAAMISHDTYQLDTTLDLPDGRSVLRGYFDSTRASEVMAFAGQNSDPVTEAFATSWRGGIPFMAIDAALAIVPRIAPGTLPSATPEATGAPPTETIQPLATARNTEPSPATQTPPPLLSTARPERFITYLPRSIR